MTKILAILAIVASMAVPALAGDGAISGAELNALGLSGMQPMSNAQAMQVRGKGYVVQAWGSSSVNVLGTNSNHGYNAVKGGVGGSAHTASGADISVVVVGAGGQIGNAGGFIVIGGIAGGASIAHVH